MLVGSLPRPCTAGSGVCSCRVGRELVPVRRHLGEPGVRLDLARLHLDPARVLVAHQVHREQVVHLGPGQAPVVRQERLVLVARLGRVREQGVPPVLQVREVLLEALVPVVLQVLLAREEVLRQERVVRLETLVPVVLQVLPVREEVLRREQEVVLHRVLAAHSGPAQELVVRPVLQVLREREVRQGSLVREGHQGEVHLETLVLVGDPVLQVLREREVRQGTLVLEEHLAEAGLEHPGQPEARQGVDHLVVEALVYP
ncbi:uncharacterized protein PG998_008176 [Apiospora kogelbergensis]|uniref:uncharacterized protein n=1 Tax=Apiospora kogelbergensis TaxID=1337665 RepID=UPI0031327983